MELNSFTPIKATAGIDDPIVIPANISAPLQDTQSVVTDYTPNIDIPGEVSPTVAIPQAPIEQPYTPIETPQVLGNGSYEKGDFKELMSKVGKYLGGKTKKAFEGDNFQSITLPSLGILESLFTKGKGTNVKSAQENYIRGQKIGLAIAKNRDLKNGVTKTSPLSAQEIGVIRKIYKNQPEIAEAIIDDPKNGRAVIKALGTSIISKSKLEDLKGTTEDFGMDTVNSIIDTNDEYATLIKGNIEKYLGAGDTKSARKELNSWIANSPEAVSKGSLFTTIKNLPGTPNEVKASLYNRLIDERDPKTIKEMLNKATDSAYSLASKNGPSVQKQKALSQLFKSARGRALNSIDKAFKDPKNATALDQLGKELESEDSAIFKTLNSLRGASGGVLTKFLSLDSIANTVLYKNLSKPGRTYFNAMRDMIRAALRMESGAVINDSEWNDFFVRYLPAPGDNTSDMYEKFSDLSTFLDNLNSYDPSYLKRGPDGRAVIAKRITLTPYQLNKMPADERKHYTNTGYEIFTIDKYGEAVPANKASISAQDNTTFKPGLNSLSVALPNGSTKEIRNMNISNEDIKRYQSQGIDINTIAKTLRGNKVDLITFEDGTFIDLNKMEK